MLFAEVFVWQHCNIFVFWISFDFIVGTAGEGVSSVGCSWFVFQEDIVLSKFREVPCYVKVQYLKVRLALKV